MPKILYRVTLAQEERAVLQAIATRGNHGSQKVLNALILLGCDEGEFQECKKTAAQLTEVLPISMKKVDRVKRRLVEHGLEVALDKRKADRQRMKKTDGDFEAHLIALSCSKPPQGHARWSLRLLADKVVELEYIDSISHETVRRVLKKRMKTVEEGAMGYSARA
jgi:tryptophan 2,3-dioxygenase